jgi:hypothetical protein
MNENPPTSVVQHHYDVHRRSVESELLESEGTGENIVGEETQTLCRQRNSSYRLKTVLLKQ